VIRETHSTEGAKAWTARSFPGFTTIGIGIVVFAVLLSGFLAYVWQLSASDRYQQEIHSRERAEARALLQQLQAQLHVFSAAVDTNARDPEVAAVLVAGDAVRMDALRQQLTRRFVGASRVLLQRRGDPLPPAGEYPMAGYADLEMLRVTLERGVVPAAEMHLTGTPYAHFDFGAPVKALQAESEETVGALLVSYADSALQQSFPLLDPGGGYVELAQSGANGQGLVLAHNGPASLRRGSPGYSLPVAGTRWELHYWPRINVPIHERLLTIATGVLLALFTLVAIVLVRGVDGALKGDLRTVADVVRDVWELRRVKRRYPTRLRALQPLVEQLAAMGQGLPFNDSGHTPVRSGGDTVVVSEGGGELKPATDDGIGAEVIEVGGAGVPAAEIFKAYDIRGIVGKTIDEATVYAIGQAIGSEARARAVGALVIARDGRLSGPALSAALAGGIRAAGCDVIDVGMVPTPVLYFAAEHLKTGSGVMVTGSHNPPDYNGLKIVVGGETLSGEAIQALRSRIEHGDYRSGSGTQRSVDIVPDYIDRIVGDVDLQRPLKLVVDCGNGVAGAVAPRLFLALGCEVQSLYCEVDGRFPHHHPDPSQPENLVDLVHAVKTSGADLGLAFDGDGDRLGVVDSRGEVIWPDRQMMLYAADVLSRHPGAEIIFDVKCSRHLAQEIEAHGGRALMWRTGHSLIKTKMKESGALLAGEMSGHIFFKERWYGFDDALYTAARLLEVLSKRSQATADVFAALPNAVSTPELRVELAEGEQFAFMKSFLAQAAFPDAQVTTIDGLRADYDDGWGLVRASNTTPSLILRFEADSDTALKRIETHFREVMLGVDPGLDLPF
jgi:phosphomannomutase/phosphoglucomutase